MHARLAALAALACALAPGRAQAVDDDPWLGRDKALHFGASAVIAAGGYGVSSLFFESRGARLGIGAGLGAAAGIGKELYDRAGNGRASWKDLTWDAAGIATGLATAWAIDLLWQRIFSEPEPQPSPASARVSASSSNGLWR